MFLIHSLPYAVLDIHFTSSLYSARKEEKYATIQIRRTKPIAQNIAIRILPLTVEEARRHNVSLPQNEEIYSLPWASGNILWLLYLIK